MSRNSERHGRGWFTPFGVVSALLAIVLFAFSAPAVAADPGNSGNGGSHGQSKDKDDKKNDDKGKPDVHGQKNGHGNAGSSSHSGGSTQGNGNGHGHSNGNTGSSGHGHGQSDNHTSHGNGGGNGNQGGSSSHGNGGGGKGDPAGNNGTVKITPHGEIDGIPQNTPHETCVFDIEWYGFDEGSDIVSDVTFEMWAPTSDVGLSGTAPSQVFVGGDPATGAGTDSGFDGEQVYTLVFDGEPHPKQGYHVKLTIHTPGSQGADTKHKVFWVQPCEDGNPPPPPEECPDGSTPIDTDGDGEVDACETDEELCPDGSVPTDLDGDGEADDCEIVGPPPSANPLGGIAVNCQGSVTVTLDNRKSTVERDYYLERIMAPTATQAERFTVKAGDIRVVTRQGNSGDVFTLSADNKELGSVTVPAKCGDNPDNPENPENPENPDNPETPGNPGSPDVPSTVNSGLVPAITAAAHAVDPWGGLGILATLIGLGLIGGTMLMKRRQHG